MSDASDTRSDVHTVTYSRDVSVSVRRAGPADVEALVALVNRAYAVEASFVGGQRTHRDEVAALVATGTFLVIEQAGGLAAAVHVDPHGYFGMLSVHPELQRLGLGTRLVRIAEAMCEAAGAETVSLKIVNLRTELGRWYRSLGYEVVATAPYTHREVRRPCHFVVMRKMLGAGAAAAA